MGSLKEIYPGIKEGFTLPLKNLEGAGVVTFGKIFFVDSVNGSDNNSGTSPAAAKATADAAIGLVTANKGDIIYLLPKHAETVTATSVALDVAGTRIIGLGEGLNRPTFTFGAAAATITVSAANCSWEGCHFIANFADVAAAFTLAAAKDFRLQNNTFADAGADLNYFNIIVTGATANAADGLKVLGNYWVNIDANAKALVSILEACDRLEVSDNFVDTGATANAAQLITLSTFKCLGVKVFRNSLILLTTGTTVGMLITGSNTSCTGSVEFNFVQSLNTTAELLDTATLDFGHRENYHSGVIAKSGYLLPAADA